MMVTLNSKIDFETLSIVSEKVTICIECNCFVDSRESDRMGEK